MEFMVMGTLKLGAMLGLGMGLVSAIKYALNFDPKFKKKEKGETDASDTGEILRQRARQLG